MWQHFSIHRRRDGDVKLSLVRDPHISTAQFLPVSAERDAQSGAVAVVYGQFFYQACPHGSEASHALRLFLEQGEAVLERLEGEFSLVVWDPRRQSLIGMRDPIGGGPLFRWEGPDGKGFSSDLRIASASSQGDVSKEFLAEFLTFSYGTGEMASEKTPSAGTFRVLPGEIVTVSSASRTVRRSYWNWEDKVRSPFVGDTREAAEGLRYVLDAAVGERVAGQRVAAHFSGGLDSTAIAALAARHVQASRSGDPLHTLSLVYKRGELAAEREQILASLAALPSARPHFLEADDILDYDLDAATRIDHAEPRGGLRGLATQGLMTGTAAGASATRILTGVGSDELFALPDFSLADAVRGFRWYSAYTQTRALARTWNQSLWSTLHENAFSLLWPVLSREGFRPFLTGGRSRWPHLGPYSIPPWIDNGFAREQGLFDRACARARQFSTGPASRGHDRKVYVASSGDWNRTYLAAPRGISFSHPFRDPRVVSFALSLPASLRLNPDESKFVLREAVKGLLPESVRKRRGKRGFDEVNGRALNRRCDAMERWVRKAKFNTLGLVDCSELCSAIRQSAMGVGDVIACDRLGQTLALMVWYEQWHHAPAVPNASVYQRHSLANVPTAHAVR